MPPKEKGWRDDRRGMENERQGGKRMENYVSRDGWRARNSEVERERRGRGEGRPEAAVGDWTEEEEGGEGETGRQMPLVAGWLPAVRVRVLL